MSAGRVVINPRFGSLLGALARARRDTRPRARTFGRFETLRRQHPDWSTARIRREIHAEVRAAGPAVRP